MRKVVFFFLCIIAALLNMALRNLSDVMFLDTIMTITVTLLGGPVWGVITGASTNLIIHTIEFWGWESYLFTICNIATALLTYLFIRLFPGELSLPHQKGNPGDFRAQPKSRRFAFVMERIVALMLLGFALCIAMSVLGGLIAAFIQTLNPVYIGVPYLSPSHFYVLIPHLRPDSPRRIVSHKGDTGACPDEYP